MLNKFLMTGYECYTKFIDIYIYKYCGYNLLMYYVLKIQYNNCLIKKLIQYNEIFFA